MKTKLFIFMIISSIILAACSGKSVDTSPNEAEKTVYAMDTVMNLSAYGVNSDNILNKAETEILRLDSLWRRKSENSEIYKINSLKSVSVSSDTSELIQTAIRISEKTDGLFDITIAPVMDLWGFYTKEFNVPIDSDLKDALSRVNYKNIAVDGKNVSVSEDTEIDLGGIAKGFLSDRITQIYRDNGIESGIVSLGGNVQTLGRKPDGKLWRVAIQNPDNENEFLGVLSVENVAVITSGGYQRYFEQDDITYHHIINPNDGFPADSGLKSVTVVSESGTLADGLSTSFYIMGLEKSTEYWRANDGFDIILLTDDNELYITDGLKDIFESKNQYNIISR